MLVLRMLMEDIFSLGATLWYAVNACNTDKIIFFCNIWFMILWVFNVETDIKLKQPHDF